MKKRRVACIIAILGIVVLAASTYTNAAPSKKR